MLSITLDDKTTRALEWLSGTRAVKPSALAVEAIQAHIRAETQRAMQREADSFLRLHPELLAAIPGQYAAIYHGRLVDHDPDQLALLQRAEERYPGLPVLIRQVQAEAEQIIHILSPRIDYA